MRALSLLALVFVAACSPPATDVAKVEPETLVAGPNALPASLASRSYVTEAGFKGDDDDAQATDLSGGACAPAGADGIRNCVFLDDQGKNAQLAAIKDGRIKPGDVFPLIVGLPKAEDVHGVAPKGVSATKCEMKLKAKDFKDFDGEAVAYADGYYYFTGSHGCARKDGDFRLSSSLLVRAKADPNGKPMPGTLERSWRLAQALASEDQYAQLLQHTAKDLEKHPEKGGDNETLNGLNVEGLAVIDGELYAGLRAPSQDSFVSVVAVSVDLLFGEAGDKFNSSPHALALGERVGIRDLAPLGKDRLLVLAGPAQEQTSPFFLQVVTTEGDLKGKRVVLPELKAFDGKQRAKAEAAIVLETTSRQARVLVLFDGIAGGGPHEVIVDLP